MDINQFKLNYFCVYCRIVVLKFESEVDKNMSKPESLNIFNKLDQLPVYRNHAKFGVSSL